MSYYPYALYLDNKVSGAIHQLIKFYHDGVFSIDNTMVYLIKRALTFRKYKHTLDKENIHYQFIKLKDLEQLEDKTIFYPFNANSNCRLVANRKLKHVFIAHGESNKIASIKPMIKIYDHVVMAGQLSLERYFKSGLFDLHDVKTNRLIQMGNTFIGKTGFSLLPKASPVVCYAPTWEGGLESENYSSLMGKNIVDYLYQKTQQLALNTVVIKPHPNTGWRLRKYRKKLFDIASKLVAKNVAVKVYLNDLQLAYTDRFLLKIRGVEVIHSLAAFRVAHAFVDISALESQFLNEGVPHNIFYDSQKIRNDIPQAYIDLYNYIGIDLNQEYTFKQEPGSKVVHDFCQKLFSYTHHDWILLDPRLRVASLASFIRNNNDFKSKLL